MFTDGHVTNLAADRGCFTSPGKARSLVLTALSSAKKKGLIEWVID
ncbi:MAG: hypothetical protein ACKVKR_07925 [Pseudomonadales bacterium]|jgi:hypothetical protein